MDNEPLRFGYRFINHYECPHDGTRWQFAWHNTCNDECPVCHAEIQPHESQDSGDDYETVYV